MAVIFSDDFNRADSTNLGPDWNEVVGDWAIASNQLHIIAYSNPMQCAYVNSISTTDYAVQAFCHTGINPKRNPGVFGRGIFNASTGRYDCYYACITPKDQTVYLYLYQAGVFTIISSTFDATIDATGNTGYTIRLEMQGSTLKVYVDGTLKITATDTTLTSGGYAGVMAGTSRTTLFWDDFLIEDFASGGTTYTANLEFQSIPILELARQILYGRGFDFSGKSIFETTIIQHLRRQLEYNSRAILELDKIIAIYESLTFKSAPIYETKDIFNFKRNVEFKAKPVLQNKHFIEIMRSLSYLFYSGADINAIRHIFHSFDYTAISQFDISKFLHYERNVEFKSFATIELLTEFAGAIKAYLSFSSKTAFGLGRALNLTKSLEFTTGTIVDITKTLLGTLNLSLEFISSANLETYKNMNIFRRLVFKTTTTLKLKSYRTLIKAISFYAKSILKLYKHRNLIRNFEAKAFAKYNTSRLAKYTRAFGAVARSFMKLFVDTSAPDVIVKYIGSIEDGGDFQTVTDFINWIKSNYPDMVASNVIIIGKIVSMRVDIDVLIDNINTDKEHYIKLMPAHWLSKPYIVHNPQTQIIIQVTDVDMVFEDVTLQAVIWFTSNTKFKYASFKRCTIYLDSPNYSPRLYFVKYELDFYNNIMIGKPTSSFYGADFLYYELYKNGYANIMNNTFSLVYDNPSDVEQSAIYFPTYESTTSSDTKFALMRNNLCYDYRGVQYYNFIRAASLDYYGADRGKTVYILDVSKNIIFDSNKQVQYIEDFYTKNRVIQSNEEDPVDYVVSPRFNNEPTGNKNMMKAGYDLSAYFTDDWTGRKRSSGNYDIGAIAEIYDDPITRFVGKALEKFQGKTIDKLLRDDKQKVTLDKNGNAYYVSLSFKSKQ